MIILIGYRATGKTTIAKLLAKKTGWAWVDTDTVIEREIGKSIGRIFSEDGEQFFREIESKVINSINGGQLIVSTGGGTPIDIRNHAAIRRGKVVWLVSSPETILSRIGDRPRLTDKPPLDEIISLLEVREKVYKKLADFIVDTDHFVPEKAVELIFKSL